VPGNPIGVAVEFGVATAPAPATQRNGVGTFLGPLLEELVHQAFGWEAGCCVIPRVEDTLALGLRRRALGASIHLQVASHQPLKKELILAEHGGELTRDKFPLDRVPAEEEVFAFPNPDAVK
jgi:hypothetical protein